MDTMTVETSVGTRYTNTSNGRNLPARASVSDHSHRTKHHRRLPDYVYQILLPGEDVLFYTRLHRLVFARPILLLMLSLPVIFIHWYAAAALFVVALSSYLVAVLQFTSSDFIVTNRRIIIKSGWISREIFELFLNKVEVIQVHQGFFGRIFNYGTVNVTGAGHASRVVQLMARPLDFNRCLQVRADPRARSYLAVQD